MCGFALQRLVWTPQQRQIIYRPVAFFFSSWQGKLEPDWGCRYVPTYQTLHSVFKASTPGFASLRAKPLTGAEPKGPCQSDSCAEGSTRPVSTKWSTSHLSKGLMASSLHTYQLLHSLTSTEVWISSAPTKRRASPGPEAHRLCRQWGLTQADFQISEKLLNTRAWNRFCGTFKWKDFTKKLKPPIQKDKMFRCSSYELRVQRMTCSYSMPCALGAV